MKKLFCFFFLLNSCLAFSQFKEPKFAEIEISDLQMTSYEKDTTADALILFDNGYTKFTMSPTRAFQLQFERHLRIKIFKKAAFYLANHEFNAYKSGSNQEKIGNIKASTFNLVNGKVVQTKLGKDNIFNEESKNYTTKKFAFPQVKEGSIIEISYVITSDFLYNLRGWKFQYKYPAIWSQYNYVIPEYFHYKKLSKGYLGFDLNLNTESETTFTLHYESTMSPGFGGGRTSSENYDLKAKIIDCTLATKDVPAFISEPNIDCEDNYIQSIDFELSSIKYPDQFPKEYAQTWESVNKQLMEDESFGQLLKSKGFINDTVKALCVGKTADLEKADAIYTYVQKRMKWNKSYSIWSNKGLKKPYQERTGNSSEINLLLTLMLQTAGLKANPVLISTRENGIGLEYSPTISHFNSVISKLEIDTIIYLLDARNEFCPMGTLPANDMNGSGRVVDDSNGDWVKLENSNKYVEMKSYVLEILPDGKLKGVVTGKYGGYAGVNYREHLSHEKNNEDFFRKIQENMKGLTINEYSIANKDDIKQAITDSLSVEITDHVEKIGDKLIFQPMLYETITKNKYTLENRKYPINYNYPITEVYVFNYTIPHEYEIESIPQSKTLKLSDNSIVSLYNIQATENRITIIYRRNINKVIFLPEEYLNLKEFYNQLVKKHSEQIILKKKV